MDTTDPNTGWQFPIMILPGDLSADDARELTHLDDDQRAAHRQARELLRDTQTLASRHLSPRLQPPPAVLLPR